MENWHKVAGAIPPLDEKSMASARARQDTLTKPLGSLGRLESLSTQLAGITGNPRPQVTRKTVIVMAGDHGVVANGVSAYPAAVTPQMVLNFLSGGAAINVLARQAGARVTVVDVGVAADLPAAPGLVSRKVAYGTADLTRGPAMTAEQAEQAITAGLDVVAEEIAAGLDLVATGDMGIGNTTPSSAIVAALSGLPVASVTGRGTGVDDSGLARKIAAIETALSVNRPKPDDAFDVLCKVGGLEIAGLAGVIIGAASRRVPVVIDGFISGAAALIAVGLAPAARSYMIPSHRSVELGAAAVFQLLGLQPLFDFDLRLGEGTGAALAFHIVEAAARILNEMATFGEAGVSEKADEDAVQDFLRALSLLTILPVRARWEADTIAGRAMAAYPLVGVLIGALLAGIAGLLSMTGLPVRAPLLPPALILLNWVLLTGALHLDGWADCCDALFVPVSRERRLEILKDPRLGSFGGVGLVLLLLVKLAAIQGAGADRPGLIALALAPVLARWAVVIAAFDSPLARPDGMAAAFRQGLGRREVILATVTAAVAVALAAWFIGWHAVLLWAVTGGLLLAVSRLATSRLGGLTGDVYGALIELVETVTLVVVCVL